MTNLKKNLISYENWKCISIKSFKTAKCEMYFYFNAFELFSNVQLNETRGD